MIKWIKEKYRIVKAFVLFTIATTPFRGVLWVAKHLRDAADSVVDAFIEVIYWALDVIEVLEDAAAK